MAAKAVLLFCAQALLVQIISGQCIRNLLPACGNGFASDLPSNLGLSGGLGFSGIAANANGGGLTVSSVSPIAPNGLSVISEYVIEGPLSVAGQLPFLSAVGVEGKLATGGQGGITYACGNGNIGLISEGLGNAAGLAPGLANSVATPAISGLAAPGIAAGFGNGIAAFGNGYGIGFSGPVCGSF